MLPLRLAFVRVGITTPVKHTPRYEHAAETIPMAMMVGQSIIKGTPPFPSEQPRPIRRKLTPT
jgi:hypothetical protein